MLSVCKVLTFMYAAQILVHCCDTYGSWPMSSCIFMKSFSFWSIEVFTDFEGTRRRNKTIIFFPSWIGWFSITISLICRSGYFNLKNFFSLIQAMVDAFRSAIWCFRVVLDEIGEELRQNYLDELIYKLTSSDEAVIASAATRTLNIICDVYPPCVQQLCRYK